MDELTINRAFVHVVDTGSFSAAARELNMAVTSVARQVTSLEALLGVQLLNRTTRKHSLTEPGRIYYDQITEIMRHYDNAKREVASYQKAIKGCLRIHLRTSLGNAIIAPALPKFLAEHPDITMHVTLTDEQADLVATGVDVAVWLGELEDSSMIARRLTPSRRVICASPAYLERFGRPEVPADLRNHNCLLFCARGYDNVWRLTRDGETIPVVVCGNLQTVSSAVLYAGAINGLGLVAMQESTVRGPIARGELVQVLADFDVRPTDADIGIYAVYPGSRRVSPKARAFIDFLVALFKGPGLGERACLRQVGTASARRGAAQGFSIAETIAASG
ncbi:MAG: LysR family transcriptional regulator [Amaricoccus sp.]